MNAVLKCRSVIVLFYCACMWSFIQAAAIEEEASLPRVMRATRGFAIDVNLELVFYQSNGVLRAYTLGSNNKQWSRPLENDNVRWRVEYGKHYLLVYAQNEVIVLDKATGKETWHFREKGLGNIKAVAFKQQDDWFVCAYEDRGVLYSIKEQRGYMGPSQENLAGWDFLPDSVRMFAAYNNEGEVLAAGKEPQQNIYKVYFGTPDSISNTVQYTLESKGGLYFLRTLSTGEMVYIESMDAGEDIREHKLQIHDAHTGELLREIPYPEGNFGNIGFTDDADYTVFIDYDTYAQVRIIDMHSGIECYALQRQGHQFIRDHDADAFGRNWMLSQDEERNIWLWPVEENSTPRKILDGRFFLPGRVCFLMPPYYLAYCRRPYPDGSVQVLSLDTGEVVAVHNHTLGYISYDKQICSKNMERILAPYRSSGNNKERKTCVFQSNRKEPLLCSDEEGQYLSPDGRYVLLQPKPPKYQPGDSQGYQDRYRRSNKTASLVDVDTGEILASFPSEDFYVSSTFSQDSRFIAIANRPMLTVLDTETHEIVASCVVNSDNYITDLCFSPDASLLAAGVRGRALIYNVQTLKLLRVLDESQKIKRRYRSMQNAGFFRKLEYKAQDVAGYFTDRFKSTPYLECSFSNDNKRVITIAAGQLMRVWNVSTGRLLNTIEPGLSESRNQHGSIDNKIIPNGSGEYAIAYNEDGFGEASLWDMNTGSIIKRYDFSNNINRVQAAVSDDGKTVYALLGEELHFLVGREEDAQ